MEQINTKQIIDEIREEVKDFPAQEVRFLDMPTGNELDDLFPFEAKAVNGAIYKLRSAADIPWYRNVGGGLSGLRKKMVRKMVAFLIAPIAEEQTRYNFTVENTIERLYDLVLEQQKRIEELETIIEDESR